MLFFIDPQRSPQRRRARRSLLLLAGLVIFLTGFWIWVERNYRSPVIFNEEGKALLAPHREKKRDRKMRELEGAIQYALVAMENNWYECFSCPDTTHIFLNTGEVWKYGYTTKKEARYLESFYRVKKLKFNPEFEGSIEACMREEVRKIIEYPLLPEALIRPVILERPPGNKKDL